MSMRYLSAIPHLQGFSVGTFEKMSKILLVSVQQRKNLNHLFKNLLSLAEVLSPIQSRLFESHY